MNEFKVCHPPILFNRAQDFLGDPMAVRMRQGWRSVPRNPRDSQCKRSQLQTTHNNEGASFEEEHIDASILSISG